MQERVEMCDGTDLNTQERGVASVFSRFWCVATAHTRAPSDHCDKFAVVDEPTDINFQ
jgi:hypothetical protein